MKSLLQVLLVYLTLSALPADGQEIVGFWSIEQVRVGDELMTPVAKWTRINKDGTFQSGNGWLQNSVGTWTYDERTDIFLQFERHGLEDEYGGFTVSFSDQEMVWYREENGVNVVVTLERIGQMPMSISDKLVGLWDLADAIKDGGSITSFFDPQDQRYLFLRWDRIYVQRDHQGERSTGYWHINAHRPEVTMISHESVKDPERWRVSIDSTELIMAGISDTNLGLKLIFQRIDQFPD